MYKWNRYGLPQQFWFLGSWCEFIFIFCCRFARTKVLSHVIGPSAAAAAAPSFGSCRSCPISALCGSLAFGNSALRHDEICARALSTVKASMTHKARH